MRRTTLASLARGAQALAFAACAAGCAGQGTVVRIADGHRVTGRFIPVEAYAAFLNGALAEQDDNALRALEAYEAAARADPEDPEIWARIARMRCSLDHDGAREPTGDEAIREALRIDPRYQPALLVAGACATLRGQAGAAMEAYSLAATWEPLSIEGDVEAAHLGLGGPELRSRLVGLTLLHREQVEAWEALEAWGTVHGDVPLAVEGMRNIVRLAPGRRYAVAGSVLALAGAGQRAAAEAVAGALLDAPGDRTAGGEGKAPASIPLVARLAVDEAISRGDREKLLARAARAHLGAEVVAGRAWAHGDPKLARELVLPTTRANPANLAARWVYEAVSGRASSVGAPSAGLAAEVALPLARAVGLSQGPEAARRVLVGVRVSPGDALLTGLAVDLAIGGVLADAELPSDARLELAARRFTIPLEADVRDPSLDMRHRLFGLSLTRPAEGATRDLAERLRGAASSDPLIAASLVNVALARREPVTPPLRATLEAFAVTDAIIASQLVELARQSGPPAAVTQARLRLASLARTPAEHQRSE